MSSFTLAEAAAVSENDLQAGVLEVFVEESPVLDRLPFMTVEGNAYAYNREATLPGVAFRRVNEGYPESTGTFAQETERIGILGGDVDVDRFIIKTRSNLNAQRALQTRAKVKSMALGFQYSFVWGRQDDSSDPLAWDGIGTRLNLDPEGLGDLGAPTSQVAESAVTREALDEEANTGRYELFDELDDLVARVPNLSAGNGALYANRTTIQRIKNVGRRIGGVEFIREDMTGKRVVMWNGIPLLDLGDGLKPAPAGSKGGDAEGERWRRRGQDEDTGAKELLPIIPDGTIFAVRYGRDESDGAVTGLANGGMDVMDLGQLQEKPVYRTRIEFYCGLANFAGNGVAALTGAALPADGGDEGTPEG